MGIIPGMHSRRDRELLERAGMLRGNKWRREWRIVMPLYDGRECPECGACCIGRESQRTHWDWHNEQREWQGTANQNFELLARKSGLPFGFEDQNHEDNDSDNDTEPDGKGSDGYVI